MLNRVWGWIKRESGFFIGMLPILVVLIIIAIQLRGIHRNAIEANRHSLENNTILKGRKPCLVETGK